MEEEDLKKWEFAKKTKRDQTIQEKLAGQTNTGGGAADPKAIGHHGHLAQFKDFADAIKKDREPLINGPEGRRAVEVILAIYKSAETGKSVSLPLKSDPVLKARKAAK
ncbi:MAG: Gfo/Idh/MocA family oxidoreductase [Blastopirellula sp. JB062]